MSSEMRNVHTEINSSTQDGFIVANVKRRSRGKEPRALHVFNDFCLAPSRATGITHRNLVKVPHAAPLNTYVASSRGSSLGFTLVELVVVVAILAILVAITIPAATSLIDNSRTNKTQSTLQLLEIAIERFVIESPMAGFEAPSCSSTTQLPLYSEVFGPYPPSPMAAFDPDPATTAICARTLPYEENTIVKFNMLLTTYLKAWYDPQYKNARVWKHLKTQQEKTPDFGLFANTFDQAKTGDFASIECLLIFMNSFSPQAKDIISQIPGNAMPNRDTCGREPCGDVVQVDLDENGSYDTYEESKALDLFEVVDGWNNPVRYDVKQIKEVKPDGSTQFVDFVWELRSAGPDGNFDLNGMFSPAENSDDVILKGQ